MRLAVLLMMLPIVWTTPAGAQIQPAGAGPAPVTLAALVAELERSNPELNAARREVDMSVARIAPAGALPDPTLSVGYMGGWLRPFFPSGSTQGSFQQLGAAQEIPYPGKLALKTRIAATEADAARWSYEDTRRELIAELKTAYSEYVYVSRSLEIVERNKTLLEQLRDVAETRFRVGKGIQQDVLRAQLEISLLLDRLEQLQRDRVALRARINGLLYRQPDTPLPATLAVETVELPPPVETLVASVQTDYPALKRDEQLVSRGQQGLALAQKEVLPDFAVRVTSQRFTGDMPWMYGVDLMVKLPLYWQRKQRPIIAEAAAAFERSRRMRENTLAMATARVTEEHAAATTSRRLVDLYGDSVLPQARLALERLQGSRFPETRAAAESLVRASRDRLKLWDITEAQIERLEATKEPRRTLTLYSPFDGIVLERNTYPGQYVTPEMMTFRIADLSTIWVLGQIFEYELPRVRLGQEATIEFPYGQSTRRLTGRITYVYPEVDPMTRRVKVRAEFRNRALELKPDTYVTVVLRASGGTRLAIPKEAVLDNGVRRYAILAHPNGYFEPREIEVDSPVDDFYPVVSGLTASDTVVTSAQFLIDSETNLQAAMQSMAHAMDVGGGPREELPARPVPQRPAAPADPESKDHAQHR